MKKIYISLSLLIAGLGMNSQTLTQANNAPANGDTYSTRQCDSLNVTPGASGAGAVWTFTNLNIHASSTSFTTVASTTSGYPPGCQATGSSTADLVYTAATSSDLKYYGGNIKVPPVAASLTYTSPAILAMYPMSLNTTGTSPIGGSINVTQPQSASGTFIGNSMTLADGSGTLMLPGGAAGTYSNVIRVLTTQTVNFSVLSGFATGVITFNNYNYYTPTIKAPLLTISTKTLTSSLLGTSTQSLVIVNKDYLAPVTTNTNDVSVPYFKIDLLELSIYPNPASNNISFTTENQTPKDVLIYDITGKLVERQNFNAGKLKLDVSDYNSGLYIYSIQNNKGQPLKTGKIAVSH